MLNGCHHPAPAALPVVCRRRRHQWRPMFYSTCSNDNYFSSLWSVFYIYIVIVYYFRVTNCWGMYKSMRKKVKNLLFSVKLLWIMLGPCWKNVSWQKNNVARCSGNSDLILFLKVGSQPVSRQKKERNILIVLLDVCSNCTNKLACDMQMFL